jgi:hypothetical protein
MSVGCRDDRCPGHARPAAIDVKAMDLPVPAIRRIRRRASGKIALFAATNDAIAFVR